MKAPSSQRSRTTEVGKVSDREKSVTQTGHWSATPSPPGPEPSGPGPAPGPAKKIVGSGRTGLLMCGAGAA